MRLTLLLCLALLHLPAGAPAQTLPDTELRTIGFEQKLNTQVPLELRLLDEADRPVRFREYFGQRPVILVLAYYDCPNLCTLVLNGLLESVRDIRLETGRDYEIVVVSIRPGELAALARTKKQTYVKRYARLGAEKGWHFLRGEEAPIRELAAAVGFQYVYEPKSGQYAHASGIVLLSPQGKITRYFFGIEYPPKALRLSLVEASQGKSGTLAERLLLLCFHYNPATGRYGLLIQRVLQGAGVGTVILLGGTLVYLKCRERKRTSYE